MDIAELVNNRSSLSLALLAGYDLSLLFLSYQIHRRKIGERYQVIRPAS
jgi:hypothetical protein